MSQVLDQHQYHNLHAYVAQPKFRRNKEGKGLLYLMQDKLCFYCRQWFTITDLTIDHFVPLAEQGGNELSNKVVACWECNHAKGSRLPTQPELQRHARLLVRLAEELRRLEGQMQMASDEANRCKVS